MNSEKTIVGIVFGGLSKEHNVSIRSAQNVINALKSKVNSNKYKLKYTYIDQKGRWWPSNIAIEALKKSKSLDDNELPNNNLLQGIKRILQEAEMVQIWYPVLHGPNGEDGSIQGLFKLIGRPFVGSGVLGSALGMDKIAMKAAFSAAGLPQVSYEKTERSEIVNTQNLKNLIKRLQNNIGYPCFIKPANLGSSIGISKAYNQKELIKALNIAINFDNRVIVEKNITARELECAVLGKKKMQTSIVGEIIHKSDWYDYQSKYSSENSTTIIPASLPKNVSDEIRKLSLAACKAISADSIARVDFFYNETNNKILINEINTLPGFTNKSIYPKLWEASGLNIEKLVAELIETAKE